MRPVVRIVTLAAAAGLASAAYQAACEARDRRRYPPPGQLVDIGGRRLHLVSMGAGTPAVVIIPALADNVLQWLPIAEGAAVDTRVIVYDRAGVGWSDPPPSPRRTPDLMAADLHAMLHAADFPPPYVLAGHSIGGIVARRFYVQHSDEVAGILLIDSSHEGQAKLRGIAGYIRVMARRRARILGARRLADSLGLMPGIEDDVTREAPPEHAGAARAIILSTRQRRTMVREMAMMVRLREAPPGLGSVPLAVLTKASSSGAEWLAWAQMQDELAALSSDSIHIHAERGGHYLQRDEPDLVIRAIRDLVRRCRVNALPNPGETTHSPGCGIPRSAPRSSVSSGHACRRTPRVGLVVKLHARPELATFVCLATPHGFCEGAWATRISDCSTNSSYIRALIRYVKVAAGSFALLAKSALALELKPADGEG
jgi:pimeloyl-ACP methyl ester carboxylesterase